MRNKQNNQYYNKKGAGNILSNKEIDFEDAMSDDDYGIIISRSGELKGLFVPKIINNNENVPDSIVAIITDIFGLELDGNEENNITIH